MYNRRTFPVQLMSAQGNQILSVPFLLLNPPGLRTKNNLLYENFCLILKMQNKSIKLLGGIYFMGSSFFFISLYSPSGIETPLAFNTEL